MNAMHALFTQKTWANNELSNLLATVIAEEHAEALHSAIRTINHVYVVDRTSIPPAWRAPWLFRDEHGPHTGIG